MSDWGRGHYERTAAELQPAAVRTIAAAAVQPGERLLDVACGTGNAALLAAAHGAAATGLDAAPRLVEVARERAAADGLDATFVAGDALGLPFADDAFDVAVSVFGVIFAQPAEQAVAELLRVVRPGGRILIASWRPGGALGDAGRLVREALDAARPQAVTPGRAATDWGDPEAICGLFAGHDVAITDEQLAFRGDDAESVAAALFTEHPVWLAACDALGPDATADLRRRTTALLAEGNEDPEGWSSTSRWLLSVVSVS